ncbi:MAG: hypothetical protein U0166_26080 [Acidobacteriota bacterium]
MTQSPGDAETRKADRFTKVAVWIFAIVEFIAIMFAIVPKLLS